jgi:dipeptidyl aminopeptidase/acylaminoacyl peptidase
MDGSAQFRLLFSFLTRALVLSVHRAAAQAPVPQRSLPYPWSLTVADVIGLTSFGYPDEVNVRSPSGERIAVIVRHGDMARNLVISTVVVFQQQQLFTTPRMDTVATLASASNRPAISRLRWLADNRTIAFLGERGEQGDTLSQVYTVDTDTRQLTQRTHHPTAVTAFDIGEGGHPLLYTALPPPTDTSEYVTQRRHGFVLRPTQFLGDIIAGQWAVKPTFISELFLTRREGEEPARLPSPADSGYSICWDSYLSLSPTGTTALLACKPRIVPSEWAQYHDLFIRELVEKGAAWPQYVVLDLVHGNLKPLMNVPTIYPPFAGPVIPWAPDGHAVVLGNTFLPLNVTDARERRWRTEHRAVVEVDVRTLEVTVITREDSLLAVRWEGATNTVELARGGGVEPRYLDASPRVRYRKTDTGWQRIATSRQAVSQAAPAVVVEQGMNTSPRLVAVAPATGARRVLFDPNPGLLERFRFGREQVVHWTSPAGARWDGGLYLPPDYDTRQRYPLVIQTHGFDSTLFVPDGPFPTANAAQAMAGIGMIVLQIGDSYEGLSVQVTPREGPAFREGIEAAIDHLDSLRLIDPSRVGLIGFSRTCYHVLYTLTHSRYPIAAAVVTDGIDFSYLQHLLFHQNALAEFDAINGGEPWGKNFDMWRERAPGFNLNRVTSPLRLEAIGLSSVLEEWEPYAGLLLQHKPVELFVIPEGSHVLVKPWERLASSQGNVDWFRFWLKGEEDPDPTKAEQYARWRELRKLQQQQRATDTTAARN